MKPYRPDLSDLIRTAIDRVGIKYNEPFTAIFEDGNDRFVYKYKVDEDLELYVYDKEQDSWKKDIDTVATLLFDEYTSFKVEPWKPAEMELYFSVSVAGEIHEGIFISGCTKDVLNYLVGNCFRTEKEALNNKKEILKRFKGEPLA